MFMKYEWMFLTYNIYIEINAIISCSFICQWFPMVFLLHHKINKLPFPLTSPPIFLNNKQIPSINTLKPLGLLFDKNLKWYKHLQKI